MCIWHVLSAVSIRIRQLNAYARPISSVHLHFTNHFVKSAHLFTHQVKTVRRVGVLCSATQFVSVRKDMYSYSSDNHRAEAPWEPLFSEPCILFKHVSPHSFLLPTLYFLPPRLNCTPFSQISCKLRDFHGIDFFNTNK